MRSSYKQQKTAAVAAAVVVVVVVVAAPAAAAVAVIVVMVLKKCKAAVPASGVKYPGPLFDRGLPTMALLPGGAYVTWSYFRESSAVVPCLCPESKLSLPDKLGS